MCIRSLGQFGIIHGHFPCTLFTLCLNDRSRYTRWTRCIYFVVWLEADLGKIMEGERPVHSIQQTSTFTSPRLAPTLASSSTLGEKYHHISVLNVMINGITRLFVPCSSMSLLKVKRVIGLAKSENLIWKYLKRCRSDLIKSFFYSLRAKVNRHCQIPAVQNRNLSLRIRMFYRNFFFTRRESCLMIMCCTWAAEYWIRFLLALRVCI